jgi:hypothetical protein
LIIFSLVFLGFAIQSAPAAQAVNVQYIHDYIYKVHGVTVPIKTTTPLQIANVKYLLCAVDKTNSLCGGATTSYCTHALATTQVVDTVATIDAVNRLVKCPISRATAPTRCYTYTDDQYVNENTVDYCEGGSVGGQPISWFVVGGYCSPTYRSSTTIQIVTCNDCVPAAQYNQYSGGASCYCKIHSINGMAVAPSSRFVTNTNYSDYTTCRSDCSHTCAYMAVRLTSDTYRYDVGAFFSALGN